MRTIYLADSIKKEEGNLSLLLKKLINRNRNRIAANAMISFFGMLCMQLHHILSPFFTLRKSITNLYPHSKKHFHYL